MILTYELCQEELEKAVARYIFHKVGSSYGLVEEGDVVFHYRGKLIDTDLTAMAVVNRHPDR